MKKITVILFFLVMCVASRAQTHADYLLSNDSCRYVLIETDYGNMVVRLYNETPLHRDNFVKLVESGFYDSLLFHRVIDRFMIQGGDPQSKYAKPGEMLGNGSLGYTIQAEFNPNFIHKKGALAAARTGDDVNPNKESSSCQFYIVQGVNWMAEQIQSFADSYGKHYTAEQIETYITQGGTPHLDNEYTIFGEVVQGIEVIDKIASVRCDMMNRPIQDIRMSMKLLR